MDRNRFDDLTRNLAQHSSRRGFFKLLGATAGGLVASLAARNVDAATCRPPSSTCREHANCCSGICEEKGSGRKVCVCPPGTTECDRTCKTPADFASDVKNCGTCGNSCPGAKCRKAACQNGTCTTVPNPNANGNTCDDGNTCTSNDICQDGVCAGTAKTCTNQDQCHEGYCDQTDGQCKQRALTGTSCSDGNACTTNDTCQNGTCQGTAVTCPECQHCEGGACVNNPNGSPAPLGRICCGGQSADILTDERHCGGCFKSCKLGEICAGTGQCQADPSICLGNGVACDSSNNTCCSELCPGGTCICLPSGTIVPPVPGPPCTTDNNCCSQICLGTPESPVGTCVCLPLAAPCDHPWNCCSGECNEGICSPFA
jgi:hypothetical protein